MKLLRPLASLAFAALATLLPVPPASAQQGVDSDTITLGHTGALSGPLSALSREYLSGAELYFDQLNAKGGVAGRRIRIVTLDDAYKPELAEQNTRRLIDEHKVFALFGCFGTGPSLKSIPLATAARVPFFAPYTGADALREPQNPYVFHVRASYRQEVEKMVNHLYSVGTHSIAVVHHADPFGQAGLEAAISTMKRLGLTPVAVASIASDGSNAAKAAAQAVAGNPAAVIMITAGNSSAALVRAIQDTGHGPMLYGLSVISSRQLILELGPKAHGLVLAQVMPSPFRVDFPIAREYRQVADKVGVDHSYAALEGYVAAATFSEGLRRAGKELTRERLLEALESMGNWDAGGLHMNFSARNHVGLDFVDLTVISRGNFMR